jgi:hypothetical protein
MDGRYDEMEEDNDWDRDFNSDGSNKQYIAWGNLFATIIFHDDWHVNKKATKHIET